jgi:colicin import membrane protein
VSNTALRKLIPNDLKESLLGSLGVHIAIILIFTVRAVFFPSADMTYESAVKVDIIALPDKIDLDKIPPPVELKEHRTRFP